jgi:hypothetical protein
MGFATLKNNRSTSAKIPAIAEKQPTGRPIHRLYHSRQTFVHPQFLQDLASFLMKHPILQKGNASFIMKIQKRSESNVLTKLPNPQKAEVKQMTEPNNFMK